MYNIKDISDTILNKLDVMMNRDCQAGKFSLIDIRDKYSQNMDILYIIKSGEPVYFLLLDIFPKHKNVYIHDVCVNKLHRGKGIFKKSLAFLKGHYSKKGFTNFTLDASHSTKEEGLDQKARIHIFHSAGFDINPETGYFTESGEYEIIKTSILLDTGKRVEIQSMDGDKYIVKDKSGNVSSVSIDQIEKCYDSKSHQLSCPMIMSIRRSGGNKTRKRKRSIH